MSSIAIIPARGGSKRIPRKNIKNFNGVPVIFYAIEAAKKSGIFDEIIVSTDDTEIAKIAEEMGAKIPWLRDKVLADDFTTTVNVIQNVVQKLSLENIKYESVCCIYPVTPLLHHKSLIKGLEILERANCDYVVAATKVSSSPQRYFKLGDNNQIEMPSRESELTRTQDLEKYYQDAGQFYWGASTAWESGKQIFTSNSRIIELELGASVDIDTLEDWRYAELLFHAKRS